MKSIDPLEGSRPEEEALPHDPSSRLPPHSWGSHYNFRSNFSLSLLGIWAIAVCTVGIPRMKGFIMMAILVQQNFSGHSLYKLPKCVRVSSNSLYSPRKNLFTTTIQCFYFFSKWKLQEEIMVLAAVSGCRNFHIMDRILISAFLYTS